MSLANLNTLEPVTESASANITCFTVKNEKLSSFTVKPEGVSFDADKSNGNHLDSDFVDALAVAVAKKGITEFYYITGNTVRFMIIGKKGEDGLYDCSTTPFEVDEFIEAFNK